MYDLKLINTLKAEHILRLIKSAEDAGIEVVLRVPSMVN
jgi:hypothetical protein